MDLATINLMRTRAMIDFEEGDLPKAEQELSKLIDLLTPRKTVREINQLCHCLNDRATVRLIARRWDDTLADLETCELKAASLSTWNRDQILTGVYHTRAKIFGTPFSSRYNREKALEVTAKLRQLTDYLPWRVDELEANVAFHEGEWEHAARLYEQVARAVAAEGWPRAAATCRLRVGLAYLELGNWLLARQEITFAHDYFKNLGPPDQFAGAQMAMARLESAVQNHDLAWELVQQSLTGVESLIRRFRALFEQQRFLIDKMAYYQHAFAVGLAKGTSVGWLRAWTIAERAKSFYLCQLVANADIPLFEGIDPEQVKRLKELEMHIDACESKLNRLENSSPDKPAVEQELQQISEQRHTLLEAMMRANPRWGAVKTPPTFDLEAELQCLDPAWIPVSYFWQKQRDGAVLHMFYASTNREPCWHSSHWSSDELEKLNKKRKELHTEQLTIRTELFPEDLVERILPPTIVSEWKAGQHILISPHDWLRAMPLHAVPIPGHKPLIDCCPVQYIPTLALLASRQPVPPSDKVLVMGCEQDGFYSKQLKQVPSEINEINAVWSEKRIGKITIKLVDKDESPSQLGLGPENWGDYQFIHIACHGTFSAEQPFDAALRLGKEAVRASEFFGVRLGAALVSLSACSVGGQTWRYSDIDIVGDEWVGMYLPLFYAGAQTLLVSLWTADSNPAAIFMKALHSALSDDLSPAQAFGQAVQSVIGKPAKSWANWYLVGFPNTSSI